MDSLSRPHSFRDADGNAIVRRGDSSRLGRLADHARVGPGLDDCQVLQPDRYVVMAGKDVPSDHLTVPLAPLTGIEAPELSRPGAENYFADAWHDGREQAAVFQGTTAEALPRDAIALAVNSQNCRSQDRLHIHADLLDPQLGAKLKEQLERGEIKDEQWANLAPVHGHQYRALWVEGSDLKANPFQLVHDQVASERGEAYANSHMGQHSIAVVGETNRNGQAGFVIIDGNFGQGSGSAEEWLLNHADSPR